MSKTKTVVISADFYDKVFDLANNLLSHYQELNPDTCILVDKIWCEIIAKTKARKRREVYRQSLKSDGAYAPHYPRKDELYIGPDEPQFAEGTEDNPVNC